MSIEYQHASGDDCYRCGYDLRGIANDRACPECGLLAERSRRVSDELHDTRPRWLKKLARGVWLMLFAMLLLIVWPFALVQLELIRNLVGSWWGRIVELMPPLGFAIAAGLFLVGVLLLTAPEQYGPADRADRRRRMLLRILAAIPLFGVVVESALLASIGGRFLRFVDIEWWLFALFLGVLVACIPLPALLFYQLRNLAKRAHSAHLAEHCAIVGIGMSSAILYAAAMSVIFAFADRWGVDSNWTSRSVVSLVLMVLCGVSAILFLFWSVYLLIRFAIAFRSAARQLRQKWKRDDRAG